ncbi:hypothetical protein DY000_02029894 [Brassica cretica]|uniref:Uncharacterized protein n=1 Tax=Brassica cretica TaxID=69181 RepID=A0ABQ7DPP8_BRACR|nr:hypothetical protein DY000_02029894 [Brassica cretica]
MSTRSSKGIWLLLVEPLDLERLIYKSKRAVDTLQAAIGSVEIQVSIGTVHQTLIDTVHPTSIDTAHQPSIDTAHQPSINTIHPPSDTTCLEAEKVEVLILKGAVIPDVAEMNDFDLSREWYDWVGQDPFQSLPHQDPRNHIEELEDPVSRSEQNEVSKTTCSAKSSPILDGSVN